jgi:predicted dehydrogenase
MAREEAVYASEQYVIELQGRFDRADQLRYVDRSRPHEVHSVSLANGEQSGGGFKEQFEHFVDCVEKNEPPRVGGEEGLKAVELCLAVKHAVQSQQPVMLYRG